LCYYSAISLGAGETSSISSLFTTKKTIENFAFSRDCDIFRSLRFSKGKKMNTVDLGSYSKEQLQDLENAVQAELKRREAIRIADAKEQIARIAQSIGRPVGEIMGNAASKGKSAQAVPAPGACRHPTDESLVWSGRGRHPRWLKEWVAEGHKLDELVSI
jgi:DNA-binding protein H-NS